MNLLPISIVLFVFAAGEAKNLPKNSVCSDILDPALIAEIASYEKVKDEIVKFVTEGEFKGKVYDE